MGRVARGTDAGRGERQGRPILTDISKWKILDAEPRNIKEYIALAAATSVIGVWRYDLETKEFTGNRAYYRLQCIDLDTTTISRDAALERVPPSDRTGFLRALETIRDVGHLDKLEYRVMLPEGGSRWISVSGSLVSSEQGEPAALVGVAFDITDRKSAEARSAKEARRAQEILESTTDGVFMLDREWRFIYINPRAELALRGEGALLGRTVWECFPDAEHNKFGRLYRETMLSRVPSTFQEFYPEPLNRWYEAHAYPTEEGISVFFRDITDAMQMQQTTRLHQQAIESVPVGISIASYSPENDYPLVYVNPAFEQMTGYTAADVLGKNCRFLQGAETRASDRAIIRNAIETGGITTALLVNYKKDGTRFFNEFHISTVRDEDGIPTHLVGIQTEVTERIEARDRLVKQARYDFLTGVANRPHFLEKLEEVITTRCTAETHFAVVYMDIDNLKHVNDSLGHVQGDRLIAEAARRIASCLRATDTLARLGGDEFAFFCEGFADGEELESVLNRIIETMAAPLHLGGREMISTVSIGYALYPSHASDAQDLLRRADLAMYAAKKAGKNGWQAYSSRLESGRKEQHELAAHLRRAVEREEFFLVYQPRVDAGSGRIAAMEALIRWNHPERGLMMPDQFIAIAEETGLIREIGWWVIQEALRQNARWQAEGRRIVPISVNVSAVQFRHRAFISAMANSIERSGLAPGLLEVELTESLLMDEAIKDGPIAALYEQGIRIAIDDFGTGYSSLAYVARLPVNTIKIDQSFTRSAPQGGADAAVCRAIIQLAKDLHFSVVAEGVETQNQADLLRDWGCDQLQGYYFGRPMSAEEIRALL
jgi:diguanylate cyclase (GGDEF)-like protein/PAS domain S-box-containing protein